MRHRVAIRAGLALVVVLPVTTAGTAGAATTPPPPRAELYYSSTPQEARASQWYLDSMKITQAHGVTRGEGVKVCIIDSVVGRSAAGVNGVRWGESASAPELSGGSHGTVMAALVAGDGTGGTLGSAPGATVMTYGISYRFEVSQGGRPVRDDVGRGIAWCADHGAKVISLSLSSMQRLSAIAYAQARDVVLVAATGNDPRDEITSSAAGAFGVLSVAGTDKTRSGDQGSTRSGYIRAQKNVLSEYDRQGVAVLGPSANSGWRVAEPAACDGLLVAPSADTATFVSACGTSPATAVVAGVVALVRAAHPDLNAANVINRILVTAKRPPGAKVPDPYYGYGIVQAHAAVTAQVPLVAENPLGSMYTGSRGVWDPTVVPQRAEPAAGTVLPPSDHDAMPLIYPAQATARPTPMPSEAPPTTPSPAPSASSTTTSPGAATNASAASAAATSAGVPGWVWPVAALSLLVAVVSGVVIGRRRRP